MIKKISVLFILITFTLISFNCKKAIIEVTNTNIEASKNGETITTKVQSNTDWTVQSNAEWCVPATTSGKRIADIKLYISPNTTGEDRTCYVSISTNKSTSTSINVQQKGGTTILYSNYEDLYSSENSSSYFTNIFESPSYINKIYKGDNNLYLGCYSNFYKSTDYGTSWVESTSLSGQNIYSIIKSGNNVIAGTSGNGIYKSSDDCSTWSNVKLSTTDNNKNYVNDLCISGSRVFAATNNGVMYSDDYGSSWQAGTGVTGECHYICANGSYIFTVYELSYNSYLVYRSTNSGSSWTSCTSLSGGIINGIGIFENNVFAPLYSGFSGGLYQSTDNGSNWNIYNSMSGNFYHLYCDNNFLAVDYANTIYYKRQSQTYFQNVSCSYSPNSFIIF